MPQSVQPDEKQVTDLIYELDDLWQRGIERTFEKRPGMEPLDLTMLFSVVEHRDRDQWKQQPVAAIEAAIREAIGVLPEEILEGAHRDSMNQRQVALILFEIDIPENVANAIESMYGNKSKRYSKIRQYVRDAVAFPEGPSADGRFQDIWHRMRRTMAESMLKGYESSQSAEGKSSSAKFGSRDARGIQQADENQTPTPSRQSNFYYQANHGAHGTVTVNNYSPDSLPPSDVAQ